MVTVHMSQHPKVKFEEEGDEQRLSVLSSTPRRVWLQRKIFQEQTASLFQGRFTPRPAKEVDTLSFLHVLIKEPCILMSSTYLPSSDF